MEEQGGGAYQDCKGRTRTGCQNSRQVLTFSKRAKKFQKWPHYLYSIVLIICVFYRLIRMAADKNAFMEKLLKERQADFDKKQEDYTKLMDEARATRLEVRYFSNFSCMFLNPNNFFPIWILIFPSRNKLKKAFCYQKLFWPFTVWMNCSSDLKIFAKSRPSASFKSFSRSLEQFLLTVGQNNFGNKIPFLPYTMGP